MTADHRLVFLDAHGEPQGWLLLEDGQVAARGESFDGLPATAEDGTPVAVTGVVPGEAVTIHWLEVPADLAPAQATAAARLLAAEVSAQPVADLHVAVGGADQGGDVRAVALVPAVSMSHWLGRLQALGLDPDRLIPDTLLLPVPDDGFARFAGTSPPLFRGHGEAFAAESEVAELVIGGATVHELDAAAFEAGLAAATAAPVMNLRQGVFAKRKAWAVDWRNLRWLALLSAAILIVTFALQVAFLLRTTAAADATEAELRRVAAAALPGSGNVADPAALLTQRAAQARGGGYAAPAGALFDAVRVTPGVALTSIDLDGSGSLRAAVEADQPAALASLISRVEASGFAVQPGIARAAGGRTVQDLTVQAR